MRLLEALTRVQARGMLRRKVALTTFHRYECKVIDFLIASGMSIICFLAYRAITQKSLEFLLEMKSKFENHDETAGVTNNQVGLRQLYIRVGPLGRNSFFSKCTLIRSSD